MHLSRVAANFLEVGEIGAILMEHLFLPPPSPSLPLSSQLGPDFAKTSFAGKKFETDEAPLGSQRQKLLARSFHILHPFISIRFKWWPRVSTLIHFWSKILESEQKRKMGVGAEEFVQRCQLLQKLQGHQNTLVLIVAAD